MEYKFTIFFTFITNGIRRKYLKIALETLFENTSKDVPILIIDASSKEDYYENKKLFSKFTNIKYIHDQDMNPFTRCKKYLGLIKTSYVLRLLEDCAYLNLGNNNFKNIDNDIKLLDDLPKINVVQYPIIDEQNFKVDKDVIIYDPINFSVKKTRYWKGYEYYDRSQDVEIYHYLCNNLLYRTSFFKKHWGYVSKKYSNHNHAESGYINLKNFNLINKLKYLRKIFRRINKYKEKIFHSDSIITNIMITETMRKADVIHIGYQNIEITNNYENQLLKETENKPENFIEILKVFNNEKLLDKIKFKRLDKNPI